MTTARFKRLRAAVFLRARGRCECGCRRSITAESGHLDHHFGRAKAEESMATCWALHPTCDDAKTNNRPSAIHWLRKFYRHVTNWATFYETQPDDEDFDGSISALYREAAGRAEMKAMALQARGLA